MASTTSISAASGAEPHDTDTAIEPPARPVDAPPGSTAPTPGAPPGTPDDHDHAPVDDPDDHTRATVIPGEAPPPRLDFADLAAVRRWVEDVAARVDDLAAAAEDQTAPMDDRLLGPAKARDLIRDARTTLRDLIALARVGLDVGGAP